MSEVRNTAVRSLDETPGLASRWDAFVAETPDATFFHRSGWRSIIEAVFRHRTWYLFAERDGKICGVLPLAEIRSRLFGHFLSSLPFCAYGGVIGDSDAVRALECRAESLALELGVEHLEYRNMRQRHSEWPSQDIYVTFRKQIAEDDQTNMAAIPRKQRAMVRKGIKHGLVAEIDSDADRFFALYADNVRRHGTPAFPKTYFNALLEVFGKDCEVLTVSSADGQPISSVLSFYFRDEVLPYYAGDDFAARRLAGNDFKYWALMCRAREKGCRVFDYGRSKVGTGPWSFKRNWGFEPQPLYYEYRLYKRDDVPQNNPMNPKYRAAIALWRKLPLPVANFLGPMVARNLG